MVEPDEDALSAVPGSQGHILALLVAVPLITCGMYTDVRARRISNRLNLALVLAGLAISGINGGLQGLADGALGLGVGLGILIPFYVMGALGAGDVKFMAAIGTWLGPAGSLYALVGGVVLAGLFACVEIARSKQRRLYLTNLMVIANKLISRRIFNSDVASYEHLSQNRTLMPYGVFLGLGGLAVLASRAFGLGI